MALRLATLWMKQPIQTDMRFETAHVAFNCIYRWPPMDTRWQQIPPNHKREKQTLTSSPQTHKSKLKGRAQVIMGPKFVPVLSERSEAFRRVQNVASDEMGMIRT